MVQLKITLIKRPYYLKMINSTAYIQTNIHKVHR